MYIRPDWQVRSNWKSTSLMYDPDMDYEQVSTNARNYIILNLCQVLKHWTLGSFGVFSLLMYKQNTKDCCGTRINTKV